VKPEVIVQHCRGKQSFYKTIVLAGIKKITSRTVTSNFLIFTHSQCHYNWQSTAIDSHCTKADEMVVLLSFLWLAVCIIQNIQTQVTNEMDRGVKDSPQ